MPAKNKPQCRKPQELKGKPQDCSPEQVRKCHGTPEKHPCVKSDEK